MIIEIRFEQDTARVLTFDTFKTNNHGGNAECTRVAVMDITGFTIVYQTRRTKVGKL